MARRRKKKIFNYLFYFIFVLSFLSYIYITYNDNSNAVKESNYELSGIKVTYLNVGQADSILIQVDNENMLIDAGNNNDGKGIVKYLKDNNITKLNYLVGTHAHEDHIGGLDDVINSFDVEKFFMPDVLTTTKTFEDVIDALESKQVRFETPKIGDEFNLGSANVKVIYVGEDSSNLNNTSIVLKVTYNNVSFLFMGDLEKDIEEQLLDSDISSTVLKVGHHGSSTSSSDKFISLVNPKYAIISVGKNNSYNHPKKVVLDRLNKYNITTLRTDELGTIVFTSDGENINYYSLSTTIDGG